MQVLDRAKHGATFLLNAPYGPDEVWEHLPAERPAASSSTSRSTSGSSTPMAVAAEAGMGNRINTVMQPCFFQLAGVLPADEAIARIKAFVEKTYAQARRRRRRSATSPRSTARSRALGHVPLGAGRRRAADAARSCPTTCPTSSRGSPPG